jgi:hypothetical protein
MFKTQQGAKPVQPETAPGGDEKVGLRDEMKTLIDQARELLKDRVLNLDDSKMESLLAAVLRGMGIRASAKGRDRGVDVLASPDLDQVRGEAPQEHDHRSGRCPRFPWSAPLRRPQPAPTDQGPLACRFSAADPIEGRSAGVP